MRNTAPAVPPTEFIKHLGMHWLEMIDYSGHRLGNIALQWNPGSRTWTHSDAHDTFGAGAGIDTTRWRWVAHIPLPPLEPAAKPAATEAERLKAAETALNNAKGLLDTPVARRKFGDDWLYTGTVESIRSALALFASRAPAA